MLAKKLDKPGSVDLGKVNADENGDMTKEQGVALFAAYAEELDALQELMYAAGQNGLLVTLQGMDTSGKDGTLKAIAGSMNPVGVRIASFKVPTTRERAHDFLWRIHAEAPPLGQVVFFNRSHYEDVLVVRVHEMVPDKVWKERYKHINDWEELLHDTGTIVVKFYLHITKGEQEERLLAREADVEKAWKLTPTDWSEREFWNDYAKAYEDALGKCATPHAPWFVVPANHKWYRNIAVAEALLETLRPYRKGWEAKLAEIGETQKVALAEARKAKPKPKTETKTSRTDAKPAAKTNK